MVEKPSPEPDVIISEFDGTQMLNRLLGLGDIVNENGWVIRSENLTEEDLEEFMTGKKVSVDRGGSS